MLLINSIKCNIGVTTKSNISYISAKKFAYNQLYTEGYTHFYYVCHVKELTGYTFKFIIEEYE